MKGLVSKLQFDTSVFTSGKAIRVENQRDRNDFYGFHNDCLIVKAEPLQLTLAYVKEKNGGSHDCDDDCITLPGGFIEKKVLPIDLVANGLVTITLMEKAVEAIEGGACQNG